MKITCACGASIEIGDNPSADEYRELKEFKANHEACRSPRIYTRCPSCGNSTLTINKKHLLCTWHKCPNPTLIDECRSVLEAQADRAVETGKPAAPLISLHDLVINRKMTNGQLLTMLKEERIMVPAAFEKYVAQTPEGTRDQFTCKKCGGHKCLVIGNTRSCFNVRIVDGWKFEYGCDYTEEIADNG